jgi:YidC/Oxa1 family membrane protein insertase
VPVIDTVLAPLELVLSFVLAAAHAGLVGLGLPAASGGTWAASVIALVFAVRLALLPLFVRQIRATRRLAAAGPRLQEIRARYAGARDREALARMRAETAQAYSEAGASPAGCLPLLLQAPVLLSLFRVLDAAARGHAIGALGSALVAQLDSATLAGAGLTQSLLTGGLPVVVVAVALTTVMAGTLWVAQHRQLTRNTPPETLSGPAGTTQRLMRWLAPATAVVSGLIFPIGMLVYFACANTISLVQQLAVIRWLPTPGSPAAARR